MTFHESPDFRDAISAASKQLKLRPVLVEKDYWVTYVLHNLSTSEYVEIPLNVTTVFRFKVTT